MQQCDLQHFAQPGLLCLQVDSLQALVTMQPNSTTDPPFSCGSHAHLSHTELLKRKVCQQNLPVLHLYPYQANLALQQALAHQLAQVNPLFLLLQDHPVEDNPAKLLVAY